MNDDWLVMDKIVLSIGRNSIVDLYDEQTVGFEREREKSSLQLPEPSIAVVGVIIVGHVVSTGAERAWDDDDDAGGGGGKLSLEGKSEMIFVGGLLKDLVISSE